MPFHWPTFRTRALSAIVFVVIMAAGLFWNHWSFFALFSIIHFGCWMEYQRLVERIDPKYAEVSAVHRYGIMLAGWGFMIWMDAASRIGGVGLQDVGFWMMVTGFIVANVETLVNRRGKLIAHSLMGLLYISLSLGLLIGLYHIDAFMAFRERGHHFVVFEMYGGFRVLPVLVIFTMWVNDTMAYIVGSLIGRTPFSKISPKKTWEGTIGGVLLATLVIGFVFSTDFSVTIATGERQTFYYPFLKYHWYVVALISAVFGTMGDLFESKIKRLAGVKDSGQMMPGHGGFLDRFDSLLVATPFVWLYVYCFL